MVRLLCSVLLLSLLTSARPAATAPAVKPPPRQVELGVDILDITDIDEPGGKFTLHMPLGIVLAMAFAVFFLPPSALSDRMSVISASLLTVVALSYSLYSGLP